MKVDYSTHYTAYFATVITIGIIAVTHTIVVIAVVSILSSLFINMESWLLSSPSHTIRVFHAPWCGLLQYSIE